ncbi:MAG: hypothetical protein PWQ96_1349 [Clostridia bacterium]|jgi:chaperonin cofactor prefoldin|nr:hypothetical protein [Clostridiales bacterium]MDK2985707.1 hypothetical protein [Clostridia bacterium]
MSGKQKIQQCISDCQQVINDLQSLADSTTETKLKSTLNESAHHLEMCVHECQFALKQTP